MKRFRAFTFLELLIALSLFSIGMVSILQIFPVNRRFLIQSGDTTQATFLAQEELENIRAVSYDDLTVGDYEPLEAASTTTGDPLSQYTRKAVVSLIGSNRQASAMDVGLKLVDVTVYWTENGVARNYMLSTYVYKK